jgi:hypothetical protein
MQLSATTSTLPPQQEEAAQLIADARLTAEKIAEKVGVDRCTIFRWKKMPAFAARVDQYRQIIAEQFSQLAVASNAGRARLLAHKYDDLLQVLIERGKDPRMATVPGGTTGLIVLEAKSVGGKLLVEASVDVATLRELRGLSDQIGKELGQHTEKTELKGQLTIESSVRLMSDEDLHREFRTYLRDAADAVFAAEAVACTIDAAGDQPAQLSIEVRS